MLDARRAIVEDTVLKNSLDHFVTIPHKVHELRLKANSLESDRLAEFRKLTAIKDSLSDLEVAEKFVVTLEVDETTGKPRYTNEGARDAATKKRLAESAEYQAMIGQRDSSQHNLDDFDKLLADTKAEIEFLLLSYRSITSVFDLAAGLSREVDARAMASEYLGRVGTDLSVLTDAVNSASRDLKGVA